MISSSLHAQQATSQGCKTWGNSCCKDVTQLKKSVPHFHWGLNGHRDPKSWAVPMDSTWLLQEEKHKTMGWNEIKSSFFALKLGILAWKKSKNKRSGIFMCFLLMNGQFQQEWWTALVETTPEELWAEKKPWVDVSLPGAPPAHQHSLNMLLSVWILGTQHQSPWGEVFDTTASGWAQTSFFSLVIKEDYTND